MAYDVDIEDVYKFRAECVFDIGKFLSNLWPGCEFVWLKVETIEQHADAEVTMKIKNTDLDEIRIALSGVKDGHVMFETVNHAENYNGDRWYTRT